MYHGAVKLYYLERNNNEEGFTLATSFCFYLFGMFGWFGPSG